MSTDAGQSMRVELSAEFSRRCPGPLMAPTAAGTIAHVRPGKSASPTAMTATIDPDALPGLRTAMEAQREGRTFATTTSWYTRSEAGMPPIAILNVQITELELAFNLVFSIDRHARQLVAAAVSGSVVLIDPELEEALQTSDPAAALEHGRCVALEVFDREPLVLILQQQFDQPIGRRDDAQLASRAETPEQMAQFADGAREPELRGVWTAPGTPATLVLVDSGIAAFSAKVGQDAALLGVWRAMRDDEHGVARLDVKADGRRLGSWLVHDPDERFARAASSGPHVVAILPIEPDEQGDEATVSFDHGLYVAVLSASTALLTLLP